MNTIIVDYNEVLKQFNNKEGTEMLYNLPVPVFHDFLFDRFKIVLDMNSLEPHDGIDHFIKAIIKLDNKTPLPTEDIGEWMEYPIIERLWINGQEATYDDFFKECEQGGVYYQYDPQIGAYKMTGQRLLVIYDDNGNEVDFGSLIINSMYALVYNLLHRERTSKSAIHNMATKPCTFKQKPNMPKKKVFLMADINNYFYLDDEEHKKREVSCPCWSVRGHWRHLKNGRTVFVKSYLKGKRRNEASPSDREYIAESREVTECQ